MSYDEDAAKAWTRRASRLAVVPALVCCAGAGLGLFAAVSGVLTHQMPMKRAALFLLVALFMLAVAALQIALGRKARRITGKWDGAEPAGDLRHNGH